MAVVFLVLPIHLFHHESILYPVWESIPSLDSIWYLEDPRYFSDFRYHALKLLFHRMTMKRHFRQTQSFYSSLKRRRIPKILYVDHEGVREWWRQHSSSFSFHLFQVHDGPLEQRWRRAGLWESMTVHPSPSISFLDETDPFLSPGETEVPSFSLTDRVKRKKRGKRLSFAQFYQHQRVKYDLLLVAPLSSSSASASVPAGGKWSLDTENRRSIPAHVSLPAIPRSTPSSSGTSREYAEAIEYVRRHFADHPCVDDLRDQCLVMYPLDHASAMDLLRVFWKRRLPCFGPYQDALDPRQPFLWHSALSIPLNCGLLTDRQVVDDWRRIRRRRDDDAALVAPLASEEGWIRQVVGWRPYCLWMYKKHGETLRSMNFWRARRSMNGLYARLWNASTDIDPVDDAMRAVRTYGYMNHIQRLMVVGSFLFMLQIKPEEVYRCFMEWTLDAYDWVMVPNVYGMSQCVDGASLMMTRPYFSSANYICKMGPSYCPVRSRSLSASPSWTRKWNTIYHHFLHTNTTSLRRFYVTAMMLASSQKKRKKNIPVNNDLKESSSLSFVQLVRLLTTTTARTRTTTILS